MTCWYHSGKSSARVGVIAVFGFFCCCWAMGVQVWVQIEGRQYGWRGAIVKTRSGRPGSSYEIPGSRIRLAQFGSLGIPRRGDILVARSRDVGLRGINVPCDGDRNVPAPFSAAFDLSLDRSEVTDPGYSQITRLKRTEYRPSYASLCASLCAGGRASDRVNVNRRAVSNEFVSRDLFIEAVVREGDCGVVLRDYADDTFDLIVTSPPYPARGAVTDGGVRAEDYTGWFLPRAAEFHRVLKPEGTFILNLKERVTRGQKDAFVLELILALRGEGWLWTEEFVWHKRNSHPGKWPNRFRDAWERVLQFNKQPRFAMYQDAVMTPAGEPSPSPPRRPEGDGLPQLDPPADAGPRKKVRGSPAWKMVYPTNVLRLANERGNMEHGDSFPRDLPAWFIRPAHLVLRAVENRVSVARAANGGFSFLLDPRGRVLSEMVPPVGGATDCAGSRLFGPYPFHPDGRLGGPRCGDPVFFPAPGAGRRSQEDGFLETLERTADVGLNSKPASSIFSRLSGPLGPVPT